MSAPPQPSSKARSIMARDVVGGADERRKGLLYSMPAMDRLRHSIQTADNRHGQNNVAVLAACIDVPQAVVRDAPDKTKDALI